MTGSRLAVSLSSADRRKPPLGAWAALNRDLDLDFGRISRLDGFRFALLPSTWNAS